MIKITDIDHFYQLRDEWRKEHGRELKDMLTDDEGDYIITDEQEGEMEDGRLTTFSKGKKVYLPKELQTFNE